MSRTCPRRIEQVTDLFLTLASSLARGRGGRPCRKWVPTCMVGAASKPASARIY